MSETDAPFEVTTPYEIAPCDDQSGGELLDAARGVVFEVKKAESRERLSKDALEAPMTRSLNLQCKIGPLGVDGNGRYANKVMFVDLLTWFNPDVYKSDWWKKQSRFPLKSFLQATGYDPKSPPKMDDAFLEGLVGKQFIGDITVRPIRVKNADGDYVDTGDKANEVKNFKKLPVD